VIKIPAGWSLGKRPDSYGVADFAFLDMADPTGTYPTLVTCPYGATGSTLWVRETWGIGDGGGRLVDPCLNYRADGTQIPIIRFESHWEVRNKFACWDDELLKIKDGWRPSIFMPRWASRIQLMILGVRAERLHDITEEDAVAEGVQVPVRKDKKGWYQNVSGPYVPKAPTCREHFILLWETINKKRGFGWKANPWVFVVDFRKVKS